MSIQNVVYHLVFNDLLKRVYFNLVEVGIYFLFKLPAKEYLLHLLSLKLLDFSLIPFDSASQISAVIVKIV